MKLKKCICGNLFLPNMPSNIRCYQCSGNAGRVKYYKHLKYIGKYDDEKNKDYYKRLKKAWNNSQKKFDYNKEYWKSYKRNEKQKLHKREWQKQSYIKNLIS